ncbi:MAG: aminotransferase class IV [Acidobacteriota bacterium]
MHESVLFNYGLLQPSEPKLSALSDALLFGKGVFTTVAIYEGEPFLWPKHWRRLKESSSKIGIDVGEFTETKTLRALDELIAANSVRNGRARITFFDQSANGPWPYRSELRTSLLIMTADRRPRPENYTLTVSPCHINSTSPLTAVKSSNYLEKILVLDEVKGRGFDEAIQLNERDEITSACMANVFWMRAGRLHTPSLSTGCIAGTTREFVLERVECGEVGAGIEELRSAAEIFLTSAGLGIIQVSEFEGRKLKGESQLISELLPLHP